MQQIISGKKGSNRVALFCTAGVLIGLFSHLYEKDTFFITKGILGLPYKISEAIYQFMIGTDAADAEETLANLNTDFFSTQSDCHRDGKMDHTYADWFISGGVLCVFYRR